MLPKAHCTTKQHLEYIPKPQNNNGNGQLREDKSILNETSFIKL